jgi:hypothetical protein
MAAGKGLSANRGSAAADGPGPDATESALSAGWMQQIALSSPLFRNRIAAEGYTKRRPEYDLLFGR